MACPVFRADDGKVFGTEAEAVQHEQHVQALSKLKALLLESYFIQQAMQKRDVVNEEFVGRLGTWMLSRSVRTAVRGILGMVAQDVPKSSLNPAWKGNRGDQRASGAALGATPTGRANFAVENLRVAKK